MYLTARHTLTGFYSWVFYHTIQCTAVGVVTRPRCARSGVRIPAGPKHLSPLRNVQTGVMAHPASYSTGTTVPFREWDGSHPPPQRRGEVKAEVNIQPPPHTPS